MEKVITGEKRIRRKLYRVLRKTGVDKKSIIPGASYNDDLKFDNTDWIIFIYFLENTFNVSFQDDVLNNFEQVDDTLSYLISREVLTAN